MAFTWISILGVLYALWVYFLFIGMCIGLINKDFELTVLCTTTLVISSTFFYILCMVFN
jgi:hypothetical protein